MTSLKLKFRSSCVEGKPGVLYILLIHNRVARQMNTNYRLYPHEWKEGKVLVPEEGSERRHILFATLRGIQTIQERLKRVIQQLENSGKPYTTDQVMVAYRQQSDEDTTKFGVFARAVVLRLKTSGQVRLSETYLSSVNSFMRFRGEQGDIQMDELDSMLVKRYEHYLLAECGVNLNTVSFYMRNLRAIYNRAVEEGLLLEDRRPFKHVYTGVAKTAKRAVSSEIVRDIKDLDLSGRPDMALSRDLFLLCFYLRGISFVDLSLLKLASIKDGYLRYCRQKTGQMLEIKWEKRMQEIVNRHHQAGSSYLLPIITDEKGDVRQQYRKVLHRVNVHLKLIGDMVNSPVRLTTYCARHGWASQARNLNIPLSVISEAMGHGSERTTRIYLATLDNKLLDDANRMIIGTV